MKVGGRGSEFRQVAFPAARERGNQSYRPSKGGLASWAGLVVIA